MKTKLATFQNPVQSFKNYYHSLPWYSFIEKSRLKNLIKENVILKEIDESMHRLNDTELLSLEAYLKVLIKKKRDLIEALAKIVNKKNKKYSIVFNKDDPLDTQFSIISNENIDLNNNHNIFSTDKDNKESLSVLLSNLGLQDLKQANQIVFTISQINETLMRGISQQNRDKVRSLGVNIQDKASTDGLIDETIQSDADTIAFDRENISTNSEEKHLGKYHYLYATDQWTIEESAILFRIVAHVIREHHVTVPCEVDKYLNATGAKVSNENNVDFVLNNGRKYPIKNKQNKYYIDVPLSIDDAYRAPKDNEHIGLYTDQQEYCRLHLNALKKLVSQLNFRFVVNDHKSHGPRNIQLHSGLIKENAKVAGHTWIDITDNVARNAQSPNDSFIHNNAEATKLAKITPIRDEIFAIQNTLESPGYGRDVSGQAFPLSNGNALKEYIRSGLLTRVPGTDIDNYLNDINFNQIENFDEFVDQQNQTATAAKPPFWKYFSLNAAANIRRYEVLTAIKDELQAVQTYRAKLKQKVKPDDIDDLNLNNDFQKDLNNNVQLFTVKHQYNRFTYVDNKQLLGLAYESEKQMERFKEFAKELDKYKPTNFFTRWWRSSALKLVEEREAALANATEELKTYRQGLAEEMFVRVNKFVLTPQLNNELIDEYCAFINMNGSDDTKTKLTMRINYRAHLTTLLSKGGLNEANRVAVTKYIDEVISSVEPDTVEQNALIVLRKTLLGESFNVTTELTDEKISFIKKYFDPNRNKAEPKKNDLVEQAQAEQLYAACVAFDRHLKQDQHSTIKGGYDNSTLFSYFAKEFGGSNLKRIFTHAEKQKRLISATDEKAKVITYTQLIDKFCPDGQHACEVLKGYRDIANMNLKYFDAILIQGKHPENHLFITEADNFKQDIIRVKYIPIAVLPHQTQPTVVYGYDIQLSIKKKQHLGDQPFVSLTRETVNSYLSHVFASGIYKGENFALDNVYAVIGNATEKGRYIEKRLAAFFNNFTSVDNASRYFDTKFSIETLEREISFVNQFRDEVQDNVDNAIKFLYFKCGWTPKIQQVVDQLASIKLQEEIRLDRLETLLDRAANYGNDFLDDIENSFLAHLQKYNITHYNFVTGERVNRFATLLQKYLSPQFKPNAFLEEIIFRFTKSNEYRDSFVIKELEYNITQNDEARIHLFNNKWVNRLEKNDSLYIKHLPKPYNPNNIQNCDALDSNAETFVNCPIVTAKNQQRYDAMILNAMFISGVPTHSYYYNNRYNPNLQLLVEFASRSVQRELNLQLITEHLADPNIENSHWRYLPISSLDDVSAVNSKELTEEQRIRFNLFKSLEKNASVIYEVIRSRRKERGFGEELIAKTDITSKHKEEYNLYQGFTRHFEETKAAFTALYGKHAVKRMREMYGLSNIENLTNCIGESRFMQLAKLLDQALSRIEYIVAQPAAVTHAQQTIWAASFIITDAFLDKIKNQIILIEQANNYPTTKKSVFDDQLHQRLRDLQTRLNILKPLVESSNHAEIIKKQALQYIEHNEIPRLFEEVILRLIGEIHERASLLSITTNSRLLNEYVTEIKSKQKLLQDIFGLLIEHAKSFRHDSQFISRFDQLKQIFRHAYRKKPAIMASDANEVKCEMQCIDNLWQKVEQEIFIDELSLEKTASKVQSFKVGLTLLLNKATDNIAHKQFSVSLIKLLTKDNLILIRFFNTTEIEELQQKISQLLENINDSALRISLFAFLNILKGSKAQRDIDAISLYSLFNDILNFTTEGRFFEGDIDKLKALKQSPYGQVSEWDMLVRTTLDRYLADSSAPLDMLSLCDIFGNQQQQRQASAIRKARRFIEKAYQKRGHELKADLLAYSDLAEMREGNQLVIVITKLFKDLQNDVIKSIQLYDAKFKNIIVCKNYLQMMLNINNHSNKCDGNSDKLNKHIEQIANLYLYVQLDPQGDNLALDITLKRFIDELIILLNQRPLQEIPCGIDFAKGIIARLAIQKDVALVDNASADYIKTLTYSQTTAKLLANKIKSEFNSVDYFKGRGITTTARRMLIENFSSHVNKLQVIDDNSSARDIFINTFNTAQPLRIKLNNTDANSSSFKNDIRKAIDAFIFEEINKIEIKEAPASPMSAVSAVDSRYSSPGLFINLGN